MSVNITTAMVKQYSANVQMLAQQKGSRLRSVVRVEPLKGENGFFDQIGATSAQKRTSRYASMPLANVPHSRRMVLGEDYDWAELVDKQDLNKVLTDPTSKYAKGAAWAMGRAMDDEIIRAAFATAFTGKSGGTSTSFDTSSNQVAVGSGPDGMTIAKLLAAKEILDGHEVDEEDRHICMASKQFTDLLSTTQVTSSDYNTVKALVQGKVNEFLGFTFHRSERLGVDSSSYRRVIAWQKNGILLALGQDAAGQVTSRADLAGVPKQVSYDMTIGATRMAETDVVEILCSEA